MGCIEQGLLLFQVRNELRLTVDYYRRAYESAVGYGLRKALDARLALEASRDKVSRLEGFKITIACSARGMMQVLD